MKSDMLRDIALALPQTNEIRTWGHPTFRVRGKIFASLPSEGVCRVKATRAMQSTLLGEAPQVFSKAERLGRFGWIDVDLAHVKVARMRDVIADAWALAAPAPLRAEALPDAEVDVNRSERQRPRVRPTWRPTSPHGAAHNPR